MALFPRIQSPCPYKDDLEAIIDNGFCRMCSRDVHDITELSDDQRQALIGSCKDEICVSYRLPARTALAAAALSASFGMGSAALAAEQGATGQDSAQAATAAAPVAADDPEQYVEIIVGGIKQPKRTVWIDSRKASKLAALPVVYEDEAASTQDKAKTEAKSKVSSAS